jgi:hypothetical protein
MCCPETGEITSQFSCNQVYADEKGKDIVKMAGPNLR